MSVKPNIIDIVCRVAALWILVSATAGASGKEMPQMKISFNEADLNYESYVPGSMELSDTDGSSMSLSAEFKTRGATARKFTLKPALNMKLRDSEGNELDTELLGLRKASSFILDAMAIDRINMRNRVAFDIWNAFSRLPYETDFGSRNGTVGKFVEMYINGKYKGIYCLSDKINRKLLDLKKPEVSDEGEVTIRGILYKNGTNDIADQNTPGYFNDYLVWVAQYHDAWELHEPEDYASAEVWRPLADLYADSNYERYDYVREHFWLDNLADYSIHVMALGIADNWGPKNRYFSIQNVTKSDERGCFVITPWDLDTSFGGEYDGSKYGDNLKTNWTVADAGKNPPIPLSICFAQPEFIALMKSRWQDARTGAFAVDSVRERLEKYADLFIESGAWERSVKAGNPDDLIVKDLKAEVEGIVRWYENRFDEMDRYFGLTDSNEDSGVVTVENTPEGDDAVYNIHGIRVDRIQSPGIYIRNGKKIIKR